MNKKQQVMELWRRCFEDTDEFIRFYFERKYSDANSLIYEENGKAYDPKSGFSPLALAIALAVIALVSISTAQRGIRKAE